MEVDFLTRHCRLKCARWVLQFRTAKFWGVTNRRHAGTVDERGIACGRTAGDHTATNVRRLDDYWTTILIGPNVGPKAAAMASEDLALLKARVLARLPADAMGRVTYSARANAIKGRVPN
jgi:hypothetical protein